MVKIKFIVGLLIASPIIVCATANIPVAAKTNIAEQETKKINVTQKNTSTYMSELNSSTDLELWYSHKNILLSSNIEGKFSPESVVTNIKNAYQEESSKAWNNNLGLWEILARLPIKERSYLKMDWREYILHNIYFSQHKTESFKTFTAPLALKSSTILGVNENFYKLSADVVYTKDGINPYLFDNMPELIKNLPGSFSTSNDSLAPLTSIPTVQLNLLFSSPDNAIAYVKSLDCESFSAKIEYDTYSLTKMFTTKYVTENTARFGITDAFRIENYKEHKRFNDWINNKLNFRVSYKTADINDKDKLLNVSKTFLYDGMNLNVDLKINHGIFIPYSIETLEYSDDEIYIQPDYATLN